MSSDAGECAACGKGGDGLKTCTACKLVKYCSVHCQRSHRKKHKKECRKRAAELREEALFKQPPLNEDCPICFLPLPLLPAQRQYKPCCGKTICRGCVVGAIKSKANKCCAFCRAPPPKSDAEAIKWLTKRMDVNDAKAFKSLGEQYYCGDMGLPRNFAKAFDLFARAAELGSKDALYFLGQSHFMGEGVAEDETKAVHYWELAAINGEVVSRHRLGAVESRRGNMGRAMKHWMIGAKAGHTSALSDVREGFTNGHVSKSDYETTLRAYQASCDEMKSDQRELAETARTAGVSQ